MRDLANYIVGSDRRGEETGWTGSRMTAVVQSAVRPISYYGSGDGLPT